MINDKTFSIRQRGRFGRSCAISNSTSQFTETGGATLLRSPNFADHSVSRVVRHSVLFRCPLSIPSPLGCPRFAERRSSIGKPTCGRPGRSTSTFDQLSRSERLLEGIKLLAGLGTQKTRDLVASAVRYLCSKVGLSVPPLRRLR